MPFRLLLSFHRRLASVPVAAAYLFLVRSMRPLYTYAAATTMLGWSIWPYMWFTNRATYYPEQPVNTPIIILCAAAAVGAAVFCWRPTRWLAVPLFVLSLLMTALLVFAVLRYASWCLSLRSSYSEAIHEMIHMGWKQLFLAVLFIGFTPAWGIICFGRRYVASPT